ncbi:MAG: STAS domain-containing protein [Planctomycetota bacterium]
MEFARERVGKILIVTPPKLTSDGIFPFDGYGNELAGIVGAQDVEAVLMDLSNVDFAATPLLAALVRMHLQAQRRRKAFALCNLTVFVQEVLATVHLDKLFRIFPSRELAIERMSAPDGLYDS